MGRDHGQSLQTPSACMLSFIAGALTVCCTFWTPRLFIVSPSANPLITTSTANSLRTSELRPGDHSARFDASSLRSDSFSSVQQRNLAVVNWMETCRPSLNVSSQAYVAACLVIKNQHHDIVEWVEYYKWLGVGRIYVYDHSSKPPLLNYLLPFVDAGLVEYIYFKNNNTRERGFWTTAQGEVYNDCVFRTSKQHTWMMFFDSDEFLMITDPNKPKLDDLLKEYEPYGALAVNWVTFSGKPHVKRPQTGVLASYKYCYWHGSNRHVKLIVNLKQYPTVMRNPHIVQFADRNTMIVDELHRRVNGPMMKEATHTRLALYHYAVKSDQDFEEKMKRGSGDGGAKLMSFKINIQKYANSTCMLGVEVSNVCCPRTRARALKTPTAGSPNVKRVETSMEVTSQKIKVTITKPAVGQP